MSKILDDVSRTFSEFLLIPQLTKQEHIPRHVSLRSPVAKFKEDSQPRLSLNIPIVSAAMQAIACPRLAIALAMHGGISTIHCSQSPQSQAEMIRTTKKYKAGFVKSSANISYSGNLGEVRRIVAQTGRKTVAVTADGSSNGLLQGLIFAGDIWPGEPDGKPVSELMVSMDKIKTATVGISLDKAIILLRACNQKCIPIVYENGHLDSLVFRRDAFSLNEFPLQMLDGEGSLMVSAAINTHDYIERVPCLLHEKVDFIFFDSSDGYSEFQKRGFDWIRKQYGPDIIIGGGNVVSAEGFNYLVRECDADFVKVGIGGGSICITREQKGIGRGQASALIDVVNARNKYLSETGIYIPICSDGGLANDTQIIIALAMGADFVMMGRYFASLEESASIKYNIRGKTYKAYWGEGSSRAKHWQRYSDSLQEKNITQFEEGVDAYVPYYGWLHEVLPITIAKLKSTMVSCGAITLQTFSKEAVMTTISQQTFIEGGTSNVLLKDEP